jgi:hypothetical protein
MQNKMSEQSVKVYQSIRCLIQAELKLGNDVVFVPSDHTVKRTKVAYPLNP